MKLEYFTINIPMITGTVIVSVSVFVGQRRKKYIFQEVTTTSCAPQGIVVSKHQYYEPVNPKDLTLCYNILIYNQ